MRSTQVWLISELSGQPSHCSRYRKFSILLVDKLFKVRNDTIASYVSRLNFALWNFWIFLFDDFTWAVIDYCLQEDKVAIHVVWLMNPFLDVDKFWWEKCTQNFSLRLLIKTIRYPLAEPPMSNPYRIWPNITIVSTSSKY